MIDLNKAARYALKTAKEREKKGQLKSDTMSILKHCAGEVCEAGAAYAEIGAFDENGYAIDTDVIDFANELADIITCALIAAAQEGVDIEAALLRVQEKNARRAEQ